MHMNTLKKSHKKFITQGMTNNHPQNPLYRTLHFYASGYQRLLEVLIRLLGVLIRLKL